VTSTIPVINPPQHHQAVETNRLHQIIVLINHTNVAIKEDQATKRGQCHIVHQDLNVGLLLIEEVATGGHGHAVKRGIEDHEVLQIDIAGQGHTVKRDVEDRDHAVKKGVIGQGHSVKRDVEDQDHAVKKGVIGQVKIDAKDQDRAVKKGVTDQDHAV